MFVEEEFCSRWNLSTVLVHAFVLKIRSLRLRSTLHGIVTMKVCVLNIKPVGFFTFGLQR